jgi:hypothetical protein
MVPSYKFVYFRLSTIRILPNKLVHPVIVQIHSLSTHAEEEARDEEQDDGEEEDVVPDEATEWSYLRLASLLPTTVLKCD